MPFQSFSIYFYSTIASLACVDICTFQIGSNILKMSEKKQQQNLRISLHGIGDIHRLLQ